MMPDPKSIPHPGPGIEGDWRELAAVKRLLKWHKAAEERFPGSHDDRGYAYGLTFGELRAIAARAEAPQQPSDAVANWMIAHSYATGHGDTVEDMLGELEWQAKERAQQPSGGWRPDREEAANLIYRTVAHRFAEQCEPSPHDYLEAVDALFALPSPPVGGTSAS